MCVWARRTCTTARTGLEMRQRVAESTSSAEQTRRIPDPADASATRCKEARRA